MLDLGVQDTGPDGAAWALAVRGGSPALDGMVLAWTLRGAPHAYRRTDLAAVAVATAPYSETDAAKRVFDASTPLRAAGIPVLDALRTVAGHMRDIVARPTPKGVVSSRLTELLEPPFLRWCRPCGATHSYEQTFRLAALQAGLQLDPGTSPPVLRRIGRFRAPMYAHLADDAAARFDVIRGHLRVFPGARVRDVATFLDAPLREVRARWPDDAVEVAVDDDPAERAEPRFVLAADLADVAEAPDALAPHVRLLGPFDPYLQLRDRELLAAERERRAELWPVLGRPGAVVADGEVVGTWRPSTIAGRLTVRVDPWQRWRPDLRAAVAEQAERLAAHRGVELVGVETA